MFKAVELMNCPPTPCGEALGTVCVCELCMCVCVCVCVCVYVYVCIHTGVM